MPNNGGSLPLHTKDDVVRCRQFVARLARDLQFSGAGESAIATAASELAQNTLVHGHGGTCSWEIVATPDQPGIRLRFVDAGPGIQDLSLAMSDGWSSGRTLGFGLPGARRLSHEFVLHSTPGKGTTVTMLRWRKEPG